MAFYDHYAQYKPTGVGQAIVTAVARRLQGEIAAHLPGPEAAILEIGPGNGDLACRFLASGFRNYTVVEPNDRLREALTQQPLAVRNYMIPDLAEPDASQDAIIVSHVFEHLNGTPAATRFVAEAARVLRPGGLLCILSPDYLHWGAEFFNGDATHGFVTTRRRTVQLMTDQGLRPLRAMYLSGPLQGLAATGMSRLVKSLLFWAHGETNASRLYSLKTTLLRSFLIIGSKVA